MGLDSTFHIVQTFTGDDAERLISTLEYGKYAVKDSNVNVSVPFVHLRNAWHIHNRFEIDGEDNTSIVMGFGEANDLRRDLDWVIDTYGTDDFPLDVFESDNYDDNYIEPIKKLKNALDKIFNYKDDVEDSPNCYIRYTFW